MPLVNELFDIRSVMSGQNKIDVVEGEIYATIDLSEKWGNAKATPPPDTNKDAANGSFKNSSASVRNSKYELPNDIKEVPGEEEKEKQKEEETLAPKEEAEVAAVETVNENNSTDVQEDAKESVVTATSTTDVRDEAAVERKVQEELLP